MELYQEEQAACFVQSTLPAKAKYRYGLRKIYVEPCCFPPVSTSPWLWLRQLHHEDGSETYNLLTLCIPIPVTDPQGLQHLAVNHPGNRQSLRRLEGSNRFATAGANHSVNRALVIAAPC